MFLPLLGGGKGEREVSVYCFLLRNELFRRCLTRSLSCIKLIILSLFLGRRSIKVKGNRRQSHHSIELRTPLSFFPHSNRRRRDSPQTKNGKRKAPTSSDERRGGGLPPSDGLLRRLSRHRRHPRLRGRRPDGLPERPTGELANAKRM